MEVSMLQVGLGLLLLAAQHGCAIAIPSPQCQKMCGNVEIEYPFGIGANCSLTPDFNISCRVQDVISKPFIGNMVMLDISLTHSTVRVLHRIASSCYNTSTQLMDRGGSGGIKGRDTPYRFSDTQNKFTVVGCNTLAYISDRNGTGYQSGCVATCTGLSDQIDGSCSGIGCCQTTIPRGMDYYGVGFDNRFNTSQIWNFSRCSYAVLMEAAAFNFSTTYINTTKFNSTGLGKVPMVLDWAVRNGTMSCAVARRNKFGTYACLSSNSDCVDSVNGPG